MKPKVTLRDLFWLVLVCAMALGWWADRSQLERTLEERIAIWKDEAQAYTVKTFWLSHWIESQGHGKVAGVRTSDTEVTVTRPDGTTTVSRFWSASE